MCYQMAMPCMDNMLNSRDTILEMPQAKLSIFLQNVQRQ